MYKRIDSQSAERITSSVNKSPNTTDERLNRTESFLSEDLSIVKESKPTGFAKEFTILPNKTRDPGESN